MGTIRFELRTDKTDQEGKAPIRLVYQIGGTRKYFPTGKKCLPFEWDKDKQIAFPADKKLIKKLNLGLSPEAYLGHEQAGELNASLFELKRHIEKIESRFRLDGVTYSPDMVLDALKAAVRPEEVASSPKEAIADFISMFVADSASTHKAGTLKVYTGLQNHILDYERAHRFKLTFANCTLGFFKAFHSFLTKDRATGKGKDLKVVKGMNNITAAKQISTLKTILRAAKSLYKIEVNPDYTEYRVSRQDGDFEVISLTEDEFLAIHNLDLSGNKRLDQVRDAFIFSCSTGLRYSDLVQLRWEHIRNLSIKMTAAKTGQTLDVPLNPYSAAILEKYKALGLARPLPIISGQKTNDYIKEIGKLAGIDTPIVVTRKYGVKSESITYPKYELLSVHCGRRTFVTLSLQKGIPAQVVMKLSGHKTWAAFRRYVEVSEQHKRDEVAKAWGAIPILKPVKKAN
jgi:integrase